MRQLLQGLMSVRIRYDRIAILLLSASPTMVFGQASVEAALAAGGAATAAAPARNVGKAVADTLKKTGRTLQKSDTKPQQQPAHPGAKPVVIAVQPEATKSDSPKEPAKAFEAPSGIEEGMEYIEVERRFGPPALKLITGSGDTTLCFEAKDLRVDVTVRNGKVIAVRMAGGPAV